MALNTGYWNRDANIEWCEYLLHPYEYSYYIAEFWNTLSSFFIVIIGYWEFHRNYFEKKLIIPLITTGIGSMIFHATQSYIGQIIDELSMVLIAFTLLNQLHKKNMNIIHYLQFMIFSIIYIRTLNFIFFMICFSILTILIMHKCYKITQCNKIYNDILIIGTVGFTISVLLFWIPEKIFCYQNSPIDVFHFHALWHLLSVVSLRYVFMFAHYNYKKIIFKTTLHFNESDFII